MTSSAERQIANMDGAAALPRDNGELVFETPWEGRAFGLAVAMREAYGYEWREFQDLLAAEIGAAEEAGAATTYYERWLASLEKLAIAKGLVSPEELDTRTAEYESGLREDDF